MRGQEIAADSVMAQEHSDHIKKFAQAEVKYQKELKASNSKVDEITTERDGWKRDAQQKKKAVKEAAKLNTQVIL